MRTSTNRSIRRVVASGPVLLLLLLLAGAAAVEAQVGLDEYAARRAALAAEIEDGLLLAMGGAAPPRDYILFFQNPRFRYLTGFLEPDAAFLALVREGRVAFERLFVNPRDPAVETWEGHRVGAEGALDATGIRGRDGAELETVVDSLLSGGAVSRVHLANGFDPDATVRDDVTQRLQQVVGRRPSIQVLDATDAVDRLRAVKSEAELQLLGRSIAITNQAHREAMGAIAPRMNEFEIQALVEYTFRRYGSERPGFASIVGSGPNSTVLHYNANDRFMEDGDLVVIDIGALYGGYSADITRTFPVNGRFSEAQREIYQLVRVAQEAVEAVAAPGARRDVLSREAARVLAEGLAELGLIQGPDATYDGPGGRALPQLQLFYMHGLGHGIGLEVHDPWPEVLEPGVPLTIEPGLYVRPNLLTEVIPDTPRNRAMIQAIRPAVERYVGIGVRIEDDYVVTEQGLERLSLVAREIDEIEEAMAAPWDGPEPRNAEWVEWYREMR